MRKELRLFFKRRTPRWLILLIDLYVTVNTFVLAYIISNKLALEGIKHILPYLPQVAITALGVFYVTKSYRGVIRHTSFRDAIRVFYCGLLISGILAVLSLIFRQFDSTLALTIPLHIVITHFLLNTISLIFLRILYKAFYQHYIYGKKGGNRVMIYGAHETGLLTYHALTNGTEMVASIVGFIDHTNDNIGNRISGIPVYDADKVDENFIQRHKVQEIIVSYPNLIDRSVQKVVDKLSRLPVQLKTIPPVDNWLNGNFRAGQIKPIRIEDLLGRDPIRYDHPEVLEQLRGKVVLITGAAGSIGSELSRQVINYPIDTVVFVDQAESALFELQQVCQARKKPGIKCYYVVADICDARRLDAIFGHYKPQIIYHAAAYKHVPLMEDNPYEAIRNNIEGTRIVADTAVNHGVERFVLVSTDKAVNPANVMGATKRVAELYTTFLDRQHATRFIVTRFGNVLGSNGSVIPTFKKQIEKGGPVTVTHKEITRYFMTIPEACQLVLVAGSMGQGGEVFVFDIGELIRIYDLAVRMIKLSGLRYPEDIDIQITGLRPGEKIYEELMTSAEETEKTQNEKIMVARVNNNYPDDFLERLDSLIEENHRATYGAALYKDLISQIQFLIPEYVPLNSIFSEEKN